MNLFTRKTCLVGLFKFVLRRTQAQLKPGLAITRLAKLAVHPLRVAGHGTFEPFSTLEEAGKERKSGGKARQGREFGLKPCFSRHLPLTPVWEQPFANPRHHWRERNHLERPATARTTGDRMECHGVPYDT